MQTFDPRQVEAPALAPDNGSVRLCWAAAAQHTLCLVNGHRSVALVLKNYNAFVLQFLLRVKAIPIFQHIPAFIPLLQRPIFEGGMPCVAQIRIKQSVTWRYEYVDGKER